MRSKFQLQASVYDAKKKTSLNAAASLLRQIAENDWKRLIGARPREKDNPKSLLPSLPFFDSAIRVTRTH